MGIASQTRKLDRCPMDLRHTSKRDADRRSPARSRRGGRRARPCRDWHAAAPPPATPPARPAGQFTARPAGLSSLSAADRFGRWLLSRLLRAAQRDHSWRPAARSTRVPLNIRAQQGPAPQSQATRPRCGTSHSRRSGTPAAGSHSAASPIHCPRSSQTQAEVNVGMRA